MDDRYNSLDYMLRPGIWFAGGRMRSMSIPWSHNSWGQQSEGSNMSLEVLNSSRDNISDETMGYDNPGMVNKISTSSTTLPPPEKLKISNGVSTNGDGGEMGRRKSEKDYEPFDHRDVKHPTSKDGVFNGVYVLPSNAGKDFKPEDYNPYEFREVKHPTTYWETLIHMLKASLGTGILAMPHAFHNAGYVVATIGTIVIGLICTYTIHILISAEYELCKRKKVPSLTYPGTAEAAVSEGPKCVRWITPAVPIICNIFLLVYQIGSCCIYVVFVASNIKDVVDEYQAEEDRIDVRMYMVFLLIPLILINWVRNLKFLAPLSTIANCVTMVGFVIIFYYMFNDIKNINTVSAIGPLKGMPLFFGTVLFAMEAIGVVMPLENEMKNPKKFGSTFGVLNCAMIPITLLYTFVGFFGYLRFGDTVKGSITLDLMKGEVLAQCVKIMLAFAIFITHALACYVAVDISWRVYLEPKVSSKKIIWEYFLRTILVIITFLLAVAIPNLELFISLIGALCLSTMGLAFPALIQLFTFWHDIHGSQFVLFFIRNFIIIIIAILGFVIGTATSIEEIVEKLF